MNQELLTITIELLTQVTDLLYQENIQPAYMKLAAVLSKLELIIAEIDNEEEQKEITEKLKEALSAMEAGDNTLLADILQYEILEQIKNY